jgi:SOS-response transcriptional repressor LexA
MTAAAFGLTRRQSELLAFIESYIAREGQAPTVRECAKAIGNSSNSKTHWLLVQLKARGAIDFMPFRARSIIVVAKREGPLVVPTHIHARLARFCAEHDENIYAVLADAVVLHLDALEGLKALGVARHDR